MPLIDSYLVMCGGDKAQVDILHSFGVRTCHILGYMTTQKGGFSGVYLKKKNTWTTTLTGKNITY